jgi:hypothetical protein
LVRDKPQVFDAFMLAPFFCGDRFLSFLAAEIFGLLSLI